MKVLALSCPLCGGAVAPPLDDRTIRCGYCDKALRFTGEDFVPRLVLPALLSDGALQERFFALLKDPVLPSDLKRRAVVLHKRKVFVPIYLLTGKRGGVFDTVKERVVREIGPDLSECDERRGGFGAARKAYQRNAPKVLSEPDTRVVLGDFGYLYPAAAFGDAALDESSLIEVATAKLDLVEPADFRQMCSSGEVIEANIPVERVVSRGVESFGRQGEGIRLIERTTRLVYMPIFQIIFRYGEETFAITIDALEGRALSGRLPFRREWALLVGMPLAGGLGFLLGKAAKGLLVALSSSQPGAADIAAVTVFFSAVAALVLGCALGLLASVLKAPFQVEVAHGGGFKVTVSESGEVSRDPLGQLADWIADRFISARGGGSGDE